MVRDNYVDVFLLERGAKGFGGIDLDQLARHATLCQTGPDPFGLRRVALEDKDARDARSGGMMSILVVQVLQPSISTTPGVAASLEVGWHVPWSSVRRQ